MSLNRSKKPKMLVVDDEPDNLDLLYRTFRRNFNVFKADSGVRALEVLATEGEVAVIISDQRMPEMKGTEFLSKTVPQFPNTVRIILTGFTDIEDLVDAINSGQVYKYITKPWDPTELKEVVQQAADTYEVLNQRTAELQRSRSQTQLLSTLMEIAQSQANVAAALDSIVKAVGGAVETDGCVLQKVENDTLVDPQAIHSTALQNQLANDSLAQTALSSKSLQVCWDIAQDKSLAEAEPYKSSGVLAHICVPVIYQQQIIALLSTQWKRAHPLEPEDTDTIELAAQAAALVLHCLGF